MAKGVLVQNIFQNQTVSQKVNQRLVCHCTELADELQPKRDVSLDDKLKQRQSQLEMNDKYKAMMKFRRKLPSYQMQQVID